MQNNIVLENEAFYCEHLSDDAGIKTLLQQFVVKKETGAGLVNYLQNHALEEEKADEMRTYLVRDKISNEIIGYFSLKAGMVSINEQRGFVKNEFDCVPGIELANFAVNDLYKEAHEIQGLGTLIFSYFIIPIVQKVAKQIGIKMLYIFALPYPHLIHYYESLHFRRLSADEERYVHKRIKPRYDAHCIFMCQPVPKEI